MKTKLETPCECDADSTCTEHTPKTKSNHTPGPWHAMPQHQDEHTLIWADRTDEFPGALPCIAHLPWPGHIENNELEANARLIASAPDLLAALKQILAMLNQPVHLSNTRTANAIQILRADGETCRILAGAAIALAEGK